MAKKGSSVSKKKQLPGDVPWRSMPGERPVPRITSSNALVIGHDDNFQYALSIMKHPDPIGKGLASEAMVEAAGPECIIPGLVRPVRLLGIQVWPIQLKNGLKGSIKIDTKKLEPIGRELKTISKLLDKAFNLMQASFGQ